MKFKVTKNGVDGHARGSVIDIEGDKVPVWLVNKGHVIDADESIAPAPEAPQTAVTNPAGGGTQEPVTPPVSSAAERQALLAEAVKHLDGDKHFLANGAPDVRALNDLLEDDVPKFTAAERDELWPGIAPTPAPEN